MKNPAASPPQAHRAPDPDRKVPFSAWWPVGCGAMAGLALRLTFWGDPGAAYAAMLGSFIIGSPVLVGVVTVYIAELRARRTFGYYFLAPFIANLLYVLGALLILVEGWICAIVIFPLFALVGGLAGLLMGVICRVTHWPRRTIVSSVALLPLITGAFEHRLPLPNLERVQERKIHVSAPPSLVWRQLIDARDIRPAELDDAWLYRIGVPLPTAGAGEARAGEHLRHLTMGKGIHFDQVAMNWRENEAVTWVYRFAPDSFPSGALDDHVRIGGEYFDVFSTSYALSPNGNGTLLKVRMHYRVSTSFNWYAGPVADLLMGNFSEVILRFYARRAELATQSRTPAAQAEPSASS